MSKKYTECESFSVSYNIMGIATVTYSVIHKDHDLPGVLDNSIIAGGQTFTGHITGTSTNKISDTDWFETSVSLVATTN